MTIQISIKEQYIDKLNQFLNSLPKDAIEIKTISSSDNSITFKEAQAKVEKALEEIPFNKGVLLEEAFSKVLKSWKSMKL